MKKKHLLKALRKYNQLNVKIKNENIFDLLNESVALISNVPLCNICLFQGNEIDFIANYGLDFNQNSLSQLPYKEMIVKNDFFEIKDINQDSYYQNLTGFIDNKIRFFTTHSFYDSEGVLLGSINLYDYKARTLNSEQKQFIVKAALRAAQIVTDRRYMQVSHLLDVLFESTDDLIIVSSPEEILHINPGVSKLLGYSQEEILDKGFTRYLHPDDIHIFEEIIRMHQHGEAMKKLTNRLISKSGKVHYIQWTGVIEEHSKLICSIGRDITSLEEQKALLFKSEKRFRAFFENSQILFCMHSLDGSFISVNKTGANMAGYTIKEVKGKSLFDITPEDRHDLLKTYLDAIKTHGRAEGIMKIITKAGEIRTWLFNNVLQRNDQEDYIIGSAVDLTERFELEKQLKEAKFNADQASNAKSEFLANMSHEIRTPLNGIIGFTDLMLKTKLDDTQQQYINIINQSGSTLMGIINDILDFSKIEAGKLILNREKIDIQDIAAQACTVVTYGVEQKGVELLLNISENVPRYIWADETRLKQILVNLLSNAIKFTEEGEVELKISTLEELNDQTSRIRFEVRDTGIGIKKEKQEEIFDAFAQEDGSITKKYGGTGLGLTISNSLLKLAGSQLHLISDVGKGSCFYFDITLKTEKDNHEDLSLRDIKSVLVVDDNANNRRILKHMLELKKIKVDDVESGLQALLYLKNGKNYDVIIMDYHMPIMDGVETIRKIKGVVHSQKQPIIMLYSSSDNDHLQEACKELEVESRLVKPIKMREMYQVLAQLKKESTDKEKKIQEEKLKFTKGIKVLIAEDNEVNMFLTKSIIKQIAPDASIFEARDGKQAISQYQSEEPDIILMDVQMPNLNGIEATYAIRNLEKSFHVPIVALTAGAMNNEREKCLEAGMDDFMTKPIVKQDIANMFTKWIGTEESNPSGTIKDNSKNHIDKTWFNEYISLDPNFKKNFLVLLISELKKSSLELKKQVQLRDLEALKITGHKLKGTSLTAGLTELSKLAVAFELLTDFEIQYVNNLLENTIEEINIILNLLALEQ